MDQINEFRFFLVAGNEDPTYSAGLVYPARANMAVRVGDTIETGGVYALSVDENALDGELYVYFSGIDSDEQSTLVNAGMDAILSLIATGLATVVSGGNVAAGLVTEFVLDGLSGYLQEDDIIGDGLFVLKESEGWGTGRTREFVSDNGGLRVSYRVTRSEVGDDEPEYAAITPEGYKQYDGFTTLNAFEDDWWLDDRTDACQLDIEDNRLLFNCENENDDHIVATLHPSRPSTGATGAAVTMWVKKVDGAVKPVTNWRCEEQGLERAYHLELFPDFARAVEFYPQEQWRSVHLGQVPVEPDRPHLLQIERSEESIDFYVDGQRLPLEITPDLPACFTMKGWALDFDIEAGGSAEGHVDQASVRP